MLLIFLLGAMVFAGYRQMSNWWPLGVWVGMMPLYMLQFGSVQSWRREVGLSGVTLGDLALSLGITLVMLVLAFLLGRGAKYLSSVLLGRREIQ